MDRQPTTPMPEASSQSGPPEPRNATEAQPPETGSPSGPREGGPRDRTLLLVAIVVTILLAGGCAAAFVWQRQQAQDLEDRATQAERRSGQKR